MVYELVHPYRRIIPPTAFPTPLKVRFVWAIASSGKVCGYFIAAGDGSEQSSPSTHTQDTGQCDGTFVGDNTKHGKLVADADTTPV